MSLFSHPSIIIRSFARFARSLLPNVIFRAILDAKSMARLRRPFGIDGKELSNLLKCSRYCKTPFHVLNREIYLTDAAGGWQCIHELLLEQIYHFRTFQARPKILDCGANVGLSIIYFKQLFPNAEIIAFEPDPQIFKVLEDNIRTFGFLDVTLRCEAVWKENGELNFISDGGFGGRAGRTGETKDATVKAVRLRDFLNQSISFLKIDIEGAESAVIEDCSDLLANVEHLFVEFHGHRDEPQNLDRILGHINRAGFRYYIKEAVQVTHPFLPEERKEAMYDLQLNIFASRN